MRQKWAELVLLEPIGSSWVAKEMRYLEPENRTGAFLSESERNSGGRRHARAWKSRIEAKPFILILCKGGGYGGQAEKETMILVRWVTVITWRAGFENCQTSSGGGEENRDE